MCPSSGLWGGVLDCDSQFTILSPPSFDGPQLWRSTSVCSSLYLLTRAHCAQCSPSIPLWLASWNMVPADARKGHLWNGRTQGSFRARMRTTRRAFLKDARNGFLGNGAQGMDQIPRVVGNLHPGRRCSNRLCTIAYWTFDFAFDEKEKRFEISLIFYSTMLNQLFLNNSGEICTSIMCTTDIPIPIFRRVHRIALMASDGRCVQSSHALSNS